MAARSGPAKGGAWRAAATGFGLAALLLAIAGATAAPAIPRVEGVIVSTKPGKQPRIEVDTGRGRASILGDPETYAACRKGSTIVKPAFDTAYSCDGRPAASTSWGAVAAVLVELALALAAAIAGVVSWRRLATRGRA